jgi:hypothetical protein
VYAILTRRVHRLMEVLQLLVVILGPDWGTGRSGERPMGRWSGRPRGPVPREGLDTTATRKATTQHVQGGHIYIVY